MFLYCLFSNKIIKVKHIEMLKKYGSIILKLIANILFDILNIFTKFSKLILLVSILSSSISNKLLHIFISKNAIPATITQIKNVQSMLFAIFFKSFSFTILNVITLSTNTFNIP